MSWHSCGHVICCMDIVLLCVAYNLSYRLVSFVKAYMFSKVASIMVCWEKSHPYDA